MVSWVSSAAENLFATMFPADCRLCGSSLVKISRLPVCVECLSAIRPITDGTCAICGERLFPSGLSLVSATADASCDPRQWSDGRPARPPDPDQQCTLCQRRAPPFERASAYGSYEGGLRELIHLLKYEQMSPAAAVLGRMLAEAIADLEPFFGGGTVLVLPVPLHPQKLRQRRFNQSELIARAALKFRPDKDRLKLNAGVLVRLRPTQSQIGLSRHQRRENLRGAFAVVNSQEIAGREVLLVDDVFTTGTTVSECARVLRRAGASKVWVATVARTLKLEAERAELGSRIEIPLATATHG